MTDEAADLDAFFLSSLGGKGVYDALPDGVRIVFKLGGPGGGTWTVSRDRYGDVEVVRAELGRADCKLTCSTDDFVALIHGKLNVRKAFFDERIAVRGDVGLVWRLQKLLVARTGA